MKKLFFIYSLVAILISGCAGPTTQRAGISDVLAEEEARKQKILALRTSLDRNARLQNLSFPLQKAAIAICEEEFKQPLAGYGSHRLNDYDKEWHEAAISEYGLGKSSMLFYVIPDSPAEQAGLMAGDVIVSFDGNNLPLVDKGRKLSQKIWDKSIKDGIVNVAILRKDERINMVVRPINVCNYPVMYVDNDTVNAYADGQAVYVTKGLMRFANDEELSAVIAHEIAHNAMEHIESKQVNRIGGLVIDILVAGTTGVYTDFSSIAGNVYSQEFEAEADYVGIYIMARAGLNIDNIANFWRRMGIENPGSINKNLSATHPSTPERFVGIENTVAEIKEKIKNNEPLIPNLKK